jgi:hypothetical protein
VLDSFIRGAAHLFLLAVLGFQRHDPCGCEVAMEMHTSCTMLAYFLCWLGAMGSNVLINRVVCAGVG